MFEKPLNKLENITAVEVNVTVEEISDEPLIQKIELEMEMLKNGKAPELMKKLIKYVHNKDVYILFVDFKTAYDC